MMMILSAISCLFSNQHCTIYDPHSQSHVVSLATPPAQALPNQSKSNLQVTQTYCHAPSPAQAAQDDFACRKQFQMGLCTFLNLMSSSHAEFLSKIIQNTYLSEQTIQKLFTEYKKGCYRQKSSKMQWLEKEINHEIQKRQKITEAKSKPPSKPQLVVQPIAPPAAQPVEQQNLQSHTMSAQAQALLQLHNIDQSKFQNITVTPEQHALTLQVIDHYEALADLVFYQHAHQSALIPELVQINDLGFQAIQEKAFMLASACNNLVSEGIAIAKSIYRGFAQGVQNNFEFALHPIQALQDLTHMGCMVLHHINHRLEIISNNATAPFLENKYRSLWSHDKAAIAAVAAYTKNSTSHWVYDTSMHQKIENLSQLGTELFAAPWLAAKACSKIKNFTQVLTRFAPEIKAEQKIATTIGEIEISAAQKEQSIMQFFESEAASAFNARHGFTLMPFEEVTTLAAQYQGKIPVAMKELVESLKHHVETKLKCANIVIDPKIRKEFEVITTELQGNKINLHMDLDHIFNYGYEITEGGNSMFNRVRLFGGHYSGSITRLEKTGLITVIEEKQLSNGCTWYNIKDNLTSQTHTKTEFPKSWNEKKVIENILEAYDSIALNCEFKSSMDAFFGKTKNGINIKMVLNKTETDIQLITAYAKEL